MGDAPYISSGIGKDPNDTAVMLHRFQQMKDADWANRRRGLRNMAAYMNDLVPGHIKSVLSRENRPEQNFNILLYLIRGHVGNVLMNWFDPKFTARHDDPIDAVEALTEVYLSQKELYNYKSSAAACYENGYIYRGVEQLVLDRPNSNPRSWGLKFVNMRPDFVIFDQSGYEDQISRRAQEAYVMHYFSPSTMIRKWGMPNNKVERNVLRRLQRESQEAPVFETPTRDLYDNVDRGRFGNNYLTVEWLHIEYLKKVRRFLKSGTELPDSGYEVGTLEDITFIKNWAAQNGIGMLSDDMILTMKDDVPCLYNTVFAPELGVLLDDRKDFRQLNGHLPLYAWSFMQKNGMSLGLVDFEWDIQQDFNARELAKTKIITKTPIAGKSWIRRDMYQDEKKYRQAVDDFNDPSVPLEIEEDAPPISEGFGILPGAQIPPSILQDETFKLTLSERVGMLPPALQGRSERTSDTGIAIGRKVVEANTMMKQESESIIQHENDKHEDWVTLGIKLFGNPINMNRTFQSMGGKKSTTINQPVGVDAVGNAVMRNHIGALKRVNVIISQTKENDFVSQIRTEKAVASLQAMQPSDTNALHRAAIEYTLVTSMDQATDEDKERVKRLADMQLAIVEKNGELQLKNLDGQLNPQPQAPAPGGMPPSGGQQELLSQGPPSQAPQPVQTPQAGPMEAANVQ